MLIGYARVSPQTTRTPRLWRRRKLHQEILACHGKEQEFIQRIRETEKRSQGAYERLVRLHRHWYERLNKNLDGEGRGYSWLPSLAAFTALMVFRLGGGAN